MWMRRFIRRLVGRVCAAAKRAAGPRRGEIYRALARDTPRWRNAHQQVRGRHECRPYGPAARFAAAFGSIRNLLSHIPQKG